MRAYLTGASIMVALAAVVLGVSVGMQATVLLRHEFDTGLHSTADALAAAVDADMRQSKASLETLASAPGLAAYDAGSFQQRTRYLLREHPYWQSLALLTPDGTVLAKQALPDRQLPAAPRMAITVPVLRQGRAQGQLRTIFRPTAFNAILGAALPGPGWAALLLDDHNVVLAASNPALVGQHLPMLAPTEPSGQPAQPTRRIRLGSRRFYVAISRCAQIPWAIAYLAPARTIDLPSRLGLDGLGLLGVLGILPLGALVVVGWKLRGGIGRLAAAAHAILHDQVPSLAVPSGVVEIDEVHAALERARLALREREETRERLHQAEIALLRTERLESVGYLTTAIAHDFGNLLVLITRHLELLQQTIGQQAPASMHLDPALQLAYEATNLMSEIATFARARPARPEPTNLNDVIAESRDLLRHAAGQSVRVEFDLTPQLWTCTVDQARLRSAVFNLLINARQVMDGHGKIRISTSNTRLDEKIVRTLVMPSPVGDYVVLAVSDTGPGMSAEIRRRIFDLFFTTRETDHGMGLGLYLVAAFVRSSGGCINVESTVGVGTIFTLYLPRFQPALPSTLASA